MAEQLPTKPRKTFTIDEFKLHIKLNLLTSDYKTAMSASGPQSDISYTRYFVFSKTNSNTYTSSCTAVNPEMKIYKTNSIIAVDTQLFHRVNYTQKNTTEKKYKT